MSCGQQPIHSRLSILTRPQPSENISESFLAKLREVLPGAACCSRTEGQGPEREDPDGLPCSATGSHVEIRKQDSPTVVKGLMCDL